MSQKKYICCLVRSNSSQTKSVVFPGISMRHIIQLCYFTLCCEPFFDLHVCIIAAKAKSLCVVTLVFKGPRGIICFVNILFYVWYEVHLTWISEGFILMTSNVMNCRKIFCDYTDQIEMARNNGQWWILWFLMFCNSREIHVQ